MSIITPAPRPTLAALLAAPYDQRQRVVVVPDAVVAAEWLAIQGADWEAFLKATARSALSKAWLPMGTLLPFLRVKWWRDYFELVKRARQRGLRVNPIGQQEARQLRFPVGHPTLGTLYIANPASPTTYYPAAQFHLLTFQHKVLEAVRILAGLGAAEIDVRHAAGWSREIAAKLELPLPEAPAAASASGSHTVGMSHEILFRGRFPAKRVGALPPDLEWYPLDEAWQTLVRLREVDRAEELTFRVDYSDSHGIDASLAASAAELKLGLGGKFQRFESSTWDVYGRW